MTQETERHTDSSLAGKYLTFMLSRERYGLEILKVQEIIGVPSITRVPRTPPYIKGVINLRGRIIPVVDLRLKLGMTEQRYDERTCVIVMNVMANEAKVAVGIIVDRVLEVAHFDPNDIEPTPDYGSQLNAAALVGMARKDGNLNILLDIEKLMNIPGGAALAQISAE